MLTVTFTSKGDKIVVPAFSGISSYQTSFALLVKGLDKQVYKTGLKPLNGPVDSFGEKPVSHINLRGNLVAVGAGTQFTRSFVTYSSESDGPGLPATTKYVKVLQLKDYPSAFFNTLIDVDDQGLHIYQETPVYNAVEYWPRLVYDKFIRTVFAEMITPTRLTFVTYSQQFSLSTGLLKYSSYMRHYFEFRDDYSSYRYQAGPLVQNQVPYPGAWIQPTDVFTGLDYRRRLVLSDDQEVHSDKFTQSNLRLRADVVWKNLVIPRPLEWGDLAMQAAGNTRYLDINTSKYLADLLTIGDILSPFMGLSIFRKMSLKRLGHLVSSSSLMYHYGIRLTVADSNRLLQAVTSVMTSNALVCYKVLVARSRGVENASCVLGTRSFDVVSEKNFKLRYTPHDNEFIEMLRTAWAWDFAPTLQTAVDYLPFSFTVGWLSPDLFRDIEIIDHRTYMAMLPTYGCVMGSRIQISSIPAGIFFGEEGLDLYGNVDVIFYDRRISATIPDPISRIPGIDLDSLGRHFWEGLLLILQKKT